MQGSFVDGHILKMGIIYGQRIFGQVSSADMHILHEAFYMKVSFTDKRIYGQMSFTGKCICGQVSFTGGRICGQVSFADRHHLKYAHFGQVTLFMGTRILRISIISVEPHLRQGYFSVER